MSSAFKRQLDVTKITNIIRGTHSSWSLSDVQDKQRKFTFKSYIRTLIKGTNVSLDEATVEQIFSNYVSDRVKKESGSGHSGSGGSGSVSASAFTAKHSPSTSATSGPLQSPFEQHLIDAINGSTSPPNFVDFAVPPELRNVYLVWAKLLHPSSITGIENALMELLSGTPVNANSLHIIYEAIFQNKPMGVPAISEIQQKFSLSELKALGQDFKQPNNRAIVLENVVKASDPRGTPAMDIALYQILQRHVTNHLPDIEAGILRIHLNRIVNSVETDLEKFKLGGKALEFSVANKTTKTLSSTGTGVSFTLDPHSWKINTIDVVDGKDPDETTAPDVFMKEVYKDATKDSLFHPGFFGIAVST